MSYRRWADSTTISQGCGRLAAPGGNVAVAVPTGANAMAYRVLNLTGYTVLVYQEDDDMWNDAIPAWGSVVNRVQKPGKALLIESATGQVAAPNPKSSLAGLLPGVYGELLSSDVGESISPAAVSWPQ